MRMNSKERKCYNKALLQNSDPGKILNLVAALKDDNSKELESKINFYLKEECEAESVFHIIIDVGRQEAGIQTVDQAMFGRKTIITMSEQLKSIMVSGKVNADFITILGDDVQEKIKPYLKDMNAKMRVVMLPLSGNPISALVCTVGTNCMEETCADIMHECMMFCWTILKNCIAFEYERSLKHNCQLLLRVARNIFTRVASLEALLKGSTEQAKRLTNAEHCFVLLIDVERLEFYNVSRDEGTNKTVERRFPLNMGVPGQVLKTGFLVNVKSVQDSDIYNPEIDCLPGVKCKSLLAFPIRDQSGIIGVGQLINKIGDPFFDATDEEMALGFSVFCGVSIIHSIVFEKIQESRIRNTLANELLLYHLKVSDAEVLRMINCKGFHGHLQLISLYFNNRYLPPREFPCYVMRMFSDLNFINTFQMRPQKIARFILQVKQGYRDVPYHNWAHAFSVAQFAYSAIINFKLSANGYLSDLQCLMYFLACLMHDLDHRGTTTSYIMQGQTAVAALYSSEGSVLERHHLAQALCILNADGCDILESLPRRDYDRALVMLRDGIVATDLANFFRNARDYKMISEVYQPGNRVHTSALLALLMNAADLSDQIKDWDCVKQTAVAVMSEFFSQNDDEKSRGVHPTTSMDPEKCIIPELQIQFLKSVCIPVYQILGRILPAIYLGTAIMEAHIVKWDASIPIFAEVPILGGFTILQSPELDDQITFNIEERKRLIREAEEQRIREEEERLLEIKKAEEKAAAKKARNQ